MNVYIQQLLKNKYEIYTDEGHYCDCNSLVEIALMLNKINNYDKVFYDIETIDFNFFINENKYGSNHIHIYDILTDCQLREMRKTRMKLKSYLDYLKLCKTTE